MACSAWPNERTLTGINEAMRLDLSGALEARGHAIVGWYISDPDAALVEIERLNLDLLPQHRQALGLDLHGILDERAELWPKLMRWEAALPHPMDAHLGADQGRAPPAQAGICGQRQGKLGRVGQTQRVYLRSEVMAARHEAFVSRVSRRFARTMSARR